MKLVLSALSNMLKQAEMANYLAQIWTAVLMYTGFGLVAYSFFFGITSAMHWYDEIPHSTRIIVAGLIAVIAVFFVATWRWQYWLEWRPSW